MKLKKIEESKILLENKIITNINNLEKVIEKELKELIVPEIKKISFEITEKIAGLNDELEEAQNLLDQEKIDISLLKIEQVKQEIKKIEASLLLTSKKIREPFKKIDKLLIAEIDNIVDRKKATSIFKELENLIIDILLRHQDYVRLMKQKEIEAQLIKEKEEEKRREEELKKVNGDFDLEELELFKGFEEVQIQKEVEEEVSRMEIPKEKITGLKQRKQLKIEIENIDLISNKFKIVDLKLVKEYISNNKKQNEAYDPELDKNLTGFKLSYEILNY